jgi:hypothetical protein
MMNQQLQDDDSTAASSLLSDGHVFSSSSVDGHQERIPDGDLAEMLFDQWLQWQGQHLPHQGSSFGHNKKNGTAGSCYNNAFSTHLQHHNDHDDDYEVEEEEQKNWKTTRNGAFGRAEMLFWPEDEPQESGWLALGTATAATDVSLSSSWSSWTSLGTMTMTTTATMTTTMTSSGNTIGGGADDRLSQLRRLFDSKLPPLPSTL